MNATSLQRFGRTCVERRIPLLPRLTEVAIFVLYNSVLFSETEIGRGTRCAYRGVGVVVHRRARLGRDVLIGSNVTIGGRSGHFAVPVIEDEVFIGSGARVLGPVTVGRGSVIGANSVVLSSVPPRSVVAGVPARVLRSDIDWQDHV